MATNPVTRAKAKKSEKVNSETEMTELSLPNQEESKPMSDQIMDVADVDWGAMLNSFSSERSPVLFIKGKVRLRLLPFSDPKAIFWPVDTYYRHKKRTKYLVLAQNLDDEENPVRAVLLTQKVVKQILTQAAEGHDLFSRDHGHGIILVKSGSGAQSEINISVSPKAIKLSDDILETAASMNMAEIAAEFSKRQQEKDEEGNEESEESSATSSKKSDSDDW